MVAEKLFCIIGESGGASIKVTPEDFEYLTDRPGIVPTPYMARNMWVTIETPNALKPKEWEHYVGQSYDLIRSKLPKKVRNSL